MADYVTLRVRVDMSQTMMEVCASGHPSQTISSRSVHSADGYYSRSPPIKSIDWDTLIKDAIWRQPPFTEDKGQEKGFRDALIVQTLGKIIGDHSSNDIAFISGDSLVRQAASSKFGTTFIAYETLEELESFLTLTDNKLTNEFVRAIQARAREKFYSDKSPQSLLFRGDLVRKIKKRFYEN